MSVNLPEMQREIDLVGVDMVRKFVVTAGVRVELAVGDKVRAFYQSRMAAGP